MNQSNRFRESIENDEVVLGARAKTFSPAVIEVFGELKLDFVWLDFEHMGPSPWDSTVFEDLTRAAEAGDIELLVRLPSGEGDLVRKVLDAGVRNLLIPRIDTVNEVHEAVEASRFKYDGGPGERGSASGRSSAWGTASDYMTSEDQSVCVGVMVEKRSAVEQIEDILAVPELGFVFVGPGDLSIQLGHPGQKDHPDVIEAIESVRTAAVKGDIPIGKIAHDPDGVIEAVNEGYQIIRIGGEMEAARSVLQERLNQIQDSV